MWTKHSYKNFKRYIDYFNPQDSFFDQLATMPPIVGHTKI